MAEKGLGVAYIPMLRKAACADPAPAAQPTSHKHHHKVPVEDNSVRILLALGHLQRPLHPGALPLRQRLLHARVLLGRLALLPLIIPVGDGRVHLRDLDVVGRSGLRLPGRGLLGGLLLLDVGLVHREILNATVVAVLHDEHFVDVFRRLGQHLLHVAVDPQVLRPQDATADGACPPVVQSPHLHVAFQVCLQAEALQVLALLAPHRDGTALEGERAAELQLVRDDTGDLFLIFAVHRSSPGVFEEAHYSGQCILLRQVRSGRGNHLCGHGLCADQTHHIRLEEIVFHRDVDGVDSRF
mmetsp:Transcript_101613/g.327717  ORF Transcript_101613/g.327717 Transcript_101613/m.327717 type:complete len:298 (-) Transcript_101613:1861-2754(-)